MNSKSDPSRMESTDSTPALHIRDLKNCEIVDFSMDSSDRNSVSLSFHFEEFIAFKSIGDSPTEHTTSPLRKNLIRHKDKQPLREIIEKALSSDSGGRSSLQALDIPLQHQLQLRAFSHSANEADVEDADDSDDDEHLTVTPNGLNPSTHFSQPQSINKIDQIPLNFVTQSHFSHQSLSTATSTDYDMSVTAVSQISGLLSDYLSSSSDDDDTTPSHKHPQHRKKSDLGPHSRITAPATPSQPLFQPPSQLGVTLIALDLAQPLAATPTAGTTSGARLLFSSNPNPHPSTSTQESPHVFSTSPKPIPSSAPQQDYTSINSRIALEPLQLASIPDDDMGISPTPRSISKLSHSIRYTQPLSSFVSPTGVPLRSILSTKNGSRHDNRRAALRNLRTVAFVKPSEEILQLRIRTYTPQKEESQPIIVNPHKRPKRKKGFFNAVKSIFSGKKDEDSSLSPSTSTSTSTSTPTPTLTSTPTDTLVNNNNNTNQSKISTQSQSQSQPPVISTISTNAAYPSSPRHSASASKKNRRNSLSNSTPRPGSSNPSQDEDFLSEDDTSDSDFDNCEPEIRFNTHANGHGISRRHDDFLAMLMSWEMEYCAFRDVSFRESARMVSFQQPDSSHLDLSLKFPSK